MWVSVSVHMSVYVHACLLVSVFWVCVCVNKGTQQMHCVACTILCMYLCVYVCVHAYGF